MKKIFSVLALAFVLVAQANAQVVKIYNTQISETTPIAVYTNSDTETYRTVFEEKPEQTTEDNLLPGLFSVGDGVKVRFTKSNLYWDGNNFKFEANQTDFPISWKENHVGHFRWTVNASNSYTKITAPSIPSIGDRPFFGNTNKMTVENTPNLYALGPDQWDYLLKYRNNANSLSLSPVTVTNHGTEYANCLILAPDDFTGTLKSSYTLEEINALNLVCLPNAGSRDGGDIHNIERNGGYWSSSNPANTDNATMLSMKFVITDATLQTESFQVSIEDNLRKYGYSLRLVQDYKEPEK